MIGMVLALIGLGMPIAFVFITANLVGAYIFMGGMLGLPQLVDNATNQVTSFTLVPVPLFLLMGELFFHSGLARRVFDALDALFGRLPGRLCYLTVAGGTSFSMLTGSSMANTAMLGSLMVPEMLRRGYKPYMAMGPVLGTGGLAMLIPPSTLAVVLGSVGHIDIGRLLIAGMLPGFVLAGLYATLIYGMVRLDPAGAPQYDLPRSSAAQKLRLIVVNVLPMGLVLFGVVGTILLGLATPSEAAAFGTLGVFVLAGAFRCLTFEVLQKSLTGTIRITGMAFLIIVGSSAFSQILAFSGASAGMIQWATQIETSPTVLLLVMFGILTILGMFMDAISMVMLVTPVFIPLAKALGFDIVWFGIIMMLAFEMSVTTPPFGLLLFVMMGVAPKGTTMPQVINAALPYLGCDLVLLALLILFPWIALYLPSLMG
jgi:tripartite ATP-independent transporter DctM subunit